MDLGGVFAPTVAVSSVRIMSTLACEQNLDLRHFDIDKASAQSNDKEIVRIRVPKVWEDCPAG